MGKELLSERALELFDDVVALRRQGLSKEAITIERHCNLTLVRQILDVAGLPNFQSAGRQVSKTDKWTEEQIADIVDSYESGEPLTSIAQRYNIGRRTLKVWLTRRKVRAPRPQRRFSVDPLLVKAGGRDKLLRAAGLSNDEIKNYIADGVLEFRADHLAVKCGYHPASVWGSDAWYGFDEPAADLAEAS